MTARHAIAHGDVLACLRELPDCSFDALLCDPPYGFSFMGKKWDYDVPSADVWREALRVCKPGAPLIAFAGARTMHRTTVNIEDAGWEIRDCLMWLYGKGFPKSHDVSKAIDKSAGAERPVVGRSARNLRRMHIHPRPARDAPLPCDAPSPATALAQQWHGYGTALKPAWEPAILARKPLDGTVAENVARWGVGGLAIDACRIGRADDDVSGRSKTGSKASTNVAMTGGNYKREAVPDNAGRWPASLILDEEAAAALDAEVGDAGARGRAIGKSRTGASTSRNRMTGTAAAAPYYADNGGPSRFFYTSKVSTKEREAGCEHLALRSAGEMTEREDGQQGLSSPRAGAGRTGGARNHHPTLKPIDLTRWLASLIKPPTPGATLLVPYSGAGSEMIGALLAGWPLVFGIEGEAEYVEIAHARIAHWAGSR